MLLRRNFFRKFALNGLSAYYINFIEFFPRKKISRAIFELDLSVQFAKIGTYLEQVVDVFYVVEKSGGKVHGEQRIEEIKDTLLENIEEFLNIDDPVA